MRILRVVLRVGIGRLKKLVWIYSRIIHIGLIRVIKLLIILWIVGMALIRISVLLWFLGTIGVYVGLWAYGARIDLAMTLRIELLTVVDERGDSFNYGGVYLICYVWLDKGENVFEWKTSLFRQILHDWVELKNFTVDVELCGDVDSFEEIQTEGE